eukprot:scaffold1651_cov19-Prasinocladus_malaysianus.AAC.1
MTDASLESWFAVTVGKPKETAHNGALCMPGTVRMKLLIYEASVHMYRLAKQYKRQCVGCQRGDHRSKTVEEMPFDWLIMQTASLGYLCRALVDI